MLACDVSNRPNTILRGFVTDRTNQRVASVGRASDPPPRFQDRSGLRDQALLRVGGVNLYIGGIHSDLVIAG